MDVVIECPICSKKASVSFAEFLVETTCPSCQYCYEPVHHFDAAHLLYQGPGFADEFRAFIIHSNGEYTYEKFREGVDDKTLVARFPLIQPYRLFRGWRKGVFNFGVFLYLCGPVVASLWAWYVTHSTLYLSGVLLPWLFGKSVHLFLKNTMQQVQAVSVFLIGALICAYFFGRYNWTVFGLVCVAFRLGVFFATDAIQDRFAQGSLYADQGLYEAFVGTGAFFVTSSPQPSYMSTRKWRR
jgi:hypothetical protein